jgi:hypothetical protein
MTLIRKLGRHSNRARSTGCVSSRGSLPRRPQRTHHRRRRRRKKRRVMGGGLPPRGGIPHPRRQEPRGGRGAGARGGRGSTRHQVVRGRGDARHGSASVCCGGIWECCGGGDRRHSIVRRTLEKEEARLLHLEVSSRSSRRSGFEGLELSLLFSCSQGGADHPRTCAL